MVRKSVVLFLVLLGLYVLSPFLVEVGMGAIFAVLFYPWMRRIELGWFPNSLAAGLFTLAVTVVLFIPICIMAVSGVKSGLKELRQIKHLSVDSGGTSSDEVLDKMFATAGIDRMLVSFAKVAPIDATQASGQLKDFIGVIAARIGDTLSAFVGHVPNMVVAFSVFLFSMFYFLADGLRFLAVIRQYSVFSAAETEKLMGCFAGLCRSVILASVISGIAQALVAGSVSFAVGLVQFPLVFLIVFMASFVPVLGSFPVMVGMGLYQAGSGHLGGGVVLFASAFVLAIIDHIVRPQVIRGSSHMHPLLAFLAALGGLETLGVSGVFLGPVICGVLVEVIQLKGVSCKL